jgi:hypothetical protein
VIARCSGFELRATNAGYNLLESVTAVANPYLLSVALLMAQPNTSRALAEQLYKEQLNEDTGLIPDASIERLWLLNVLALRQEFGGFDEPPNLRRLTKPNSGLYDLSCRRAAPCMGAGTKARAKTSGGALVGPRASKFGSDSRRYSRESLPRQDCS